MFRTQELPPQTSPEEKHRPEEQQDWVACYVLNPRGKKNAPLAIRYAIFPSDALRKQHAQFILKNLNDSYLPEGIYSWVQINLEMGIKISPREYLTCPEDTILAYKKDNGGSEHATALTKSLLNACDNYVKSAGIFAVASEGKMSEWNLRSGYYLAKCNLLTLPRDTVGLPLETYNGSGEKRRNSDDATTEMWGRARALSKSSTSSSQSNSPSITPKLTPLTPVRLIFKTPPTSAAPAAPASPLALPRPALSGSPKFFDPALPLDLTNTKCPAETVKSADDPLRPTNSVAPQALDVTQAGTTGSKLS